MGHGSCKSIAANRSDWTRGIEQLGQVLGNQVKEVIEVIVIIEVVFG